MLTKSTRRRPVLALAVLSVLASLTGVARAQQSGLFPLHPIRRERVPCPNEDPIYKLYRSQYYGYFPTQWRPFPQGWNLTNPETPNPKQEFQKNPLQPVEAPPPEGEMEPGAEAPTQPAPRPTIPKPPGEHERSPFEMDRPGNVPRPTPGSGAPGRQPAPGTPPPPEEGASPFDTPDDTQGAGGTPRNPRPRAPQPSRPAPPPADTGTPDLNPPGPAPSAPSPPQTWRDREQGESAGVGDSGPLLAMPDATLPAVEEAGAPGRPAGSAETESILGGPGANAPVMTPVDSQPATTPRRSRLSSLFGGLGLNWLRR
jgi:hypothetical protein